MLAVEARVAETSKGSLTTKRTKKHQEPDFFFTWGSSISKWRRPDVLKGLCDLRALRGQAFGPGVNGWVFSGVRIDKHGEFLAGPDIAANAVPAFEIRYGDLKTPGDRVERITFSHSIVQALKCHLIGA